ncbi:plasmid mobilization relaxosome protein MobC [Bifidobacterium sp. ESL0690]|uniref:plasmid mobilization relaxosome protein MobC n=1 Tax=Bifidobacterium sp. ESL0690 TaxID=2983214 RepID=UPI0023F69B76|nr:plasmid mobilization relaxosome protein MobC [Bifidobacterium sp. ESL0690]WEV47645.1 plasmid mobilization relaxosome protein MobC [Bifidobacterium sp. ESL0690]
MAWQGNRTRPVRKVVTFTEQEWRYVRDSQVTENRQRVKAGLETVGWTRFARSRIMTGRSVTLLAPPGLDDVTIQLARIGGNVNQIAHTVNIRRRAEYAEIIETQRLLREAVGLLSLMRDTVSAGLPDPGRLS